MNSVCILLTDNESINEKIIMNSYKYLLNIKINKIYFIGSSIKFNKIFKKFANKKKFKFINVDINKNEFFKYLRNITNEAIKICNKNQNSLILNMPINKKKFLKNKFAGFTEFFSNCIDNKKMKICFCITKKNFRYALSLHIFN